MPVPYQDVETIDNVFWSCCILHNMLHTYDSMGEMEADLEWVGADGSNDKETGPPEGTEETSESVTKIEEDVGFQAFRAKLVEHFAFRAKRKSLAWLRS